MTKKKLLPDKSPDEVLAGLKKNQFQFDWLSLKADAMATIDGKSSSFKVNIRIRKDSLIWMSVSSIVGIEAVRAQVTPDSLKFMDKINSEYYIGPTDSLLEKMDIDADFETLQALLVGNSIDLKDSAELKISVQKGDYLLSVFKKRKLKKLLRKNEKIEKKSEKLEKKANNGNADNRNEKYEKKSEKLEKEDEKYDMMLQSLWVDAALFKITKIAINDLKTNSTLIAEYGNFSLVEAQQIPMTANFYLENKKNTKVRFDYSKAILNTPQSVPFTIPEKYERKY